MIVTFDLDFGEIFNSAEFGKPGIIVLRIKNQTVESVNITLKNLFTSYEDKINKNHLMLVVVKENSIRFIN